MIPSSPEYGDIFEDKKQKSNSNKTKFRYSEQYNYVGVTNTVIANKRLNKIFLEVQVRFLFFTRIKYEFFLNFRMK